MTRRGGQRTRTTHATITASHVTPVPDDPKHVLTGFCWCQPTIEVEVDGIVIIHRRTLDSPRREAADGSPIWGLPPQVVR